MSQRDRVLTTLTTMRQDIENDVAKWEGKVVDGRAISQMFGELSAIVDALTAIVKIIVEEKLDDD